MKRAMLALSLILVLALVGSAVAGEWQPTETSYFTMFGSSFCRTTDRHIGGPLNKGFFGRNIYVTNVYAAPKAPGEAPTCLSSHKSDYDGLGDGIVKGMTNNLGAGAMYAVGQAIRTPDSYRTSVNTNVSGGNTSSAAGAAAGAAAGVINANSNFQAQGQIQAQGQAQQQTAEGGGGWIPPGQR